MPSKYMGWSLPNSTQRLQSHLCVAFIVLSSRSHSKYVRLSPAHESKYSGDRSTMTSISSGSISLVKKLPSMSRSAGISNRSKSLTIFRNPAKSRSSFLGYAEKLNAENEQLFQAENVFARTE